MSEKTLAKNSVKALLEGPDLAAAIRKAAPRHLSVERFLRIATTAANRNPVLQECTGVSLWQCLLDLSATGLEPDGRRAHLIPYYDNKKKVYNATLIIDYKGYVELIMRSGKVASVHADIICENDVFEYDMGELKKHQINFKKDRGNMYGAYALIRFKDPAITPKCEVMQKAEIDAIRARSRAKDSGPWVSDYSEMAKKTAFRRATKWLELSPEIKDLIELDQDTIIPERMTDVAPTNVTPPVGETIFDRQPPPPAPPKTSKKTKPRKVTKEDSIEAIEALCDRYEIEVTDLQEYLREHGHLKEDQFLPDLHRDTADLLIQGWDSVVKKLKATANVE
jgi:recombination protein RecT